MKKFVVKLIVVDGFFMYVEIDLIDFRNLFCLCFLSYNWVFYINDYYSKYLWFILLMFKICE